MIEQRHEHTVAQCGVGEAAALVPVGLHVVALHLGLAAAQAAIPAARDHRVCVHRVEGVQKVRGHSQVARLNDLQKDSMQSGLLRQEGDCGQLKALQKSRACGPERPAEETMWAWPAWEDR